MLETAQVHKYYTGARNFTHDKMIQVPSSKRFLGGDCVVGSVDGASELLFYLLCETESSKRPRKLTSFMLPVSLSLESCRPFHVSVS